MTTTIKRPRSAAVTARLISKILRKHGFQKANTSNRYFWTEGYHVHRVGYSETVHVDWHHPAFFSYGNVQEQARKICASKVAQIREVLFELGYVSSHPHSIYIECLES